MDRPNKKLGELLRVTFIIRRNWVIFEAAERIFRRIEARPRIGPRDDLFNALIAAGIVFISPIASYSVCILEY